MNKIAGFFRALMLVVTAIWGIFFGILFPVTMLTGENVVNSPLAENPVIIMWLITSVAGFVLPCFLTMLRKRNIAVVLSVLGILSVIVMHFIFEGMKSASDKTFAFDAIITYMPLVLGGISAIVANLLSAEV
ncbi:hypothetical protein FACS1894120_1900 [Clostridia bacterium]|nr:hypothetical protein FACS1894120_1900 [Clostridia bacterium]